MQPPDTRYTSVGDINIAYQVLGSGPDVIIVPMFIGHLDLMWTEPGVERFIRHAASFSRLIVFDMPGTGLSDRVSRVLTLEERVAVIGAVLDAAGSERAALAGMSQGGQASMVFAATYPERTSALILYATYPKWPSKRELPEMLAEIEGNATEERVEEFSRRLDGIDRGLQTMLDHWGEGRSLDLVAGPPHSPLERRFWAVFERASVSPGGARTILRAAHELDVTEILPAIRTPTLVFHPTYDPVVPVEAGRYLAHKVAGARFIEVPGAHHGFMFGDVVAMAAEVERFLTGTSRAWNPRRAFAAVLFTDIVASTERAAELGDQRWRELLERHDTLVHQRVEAGGGRIVKHTGDGFQIVFERSADAIGCAEAICAAAKGLGLRVRAGVHSGECELIRNDIAGLAVHIAARVGALAEPDEVLVSSTVKNLVVESGIEFTDRGVHRLKGVPGEWRLFAARAAGAHGDRGRLRASPRDHMTGSDRIAVGVAGRTPGLARTATRVIRLRLRRSSVGTRRISA